MASSGITRPTNFFIFSYLLQYLLLVFRQGIEYILFFQAFFQECFFSSKSITGTSVGAEISICSLMSFIVLGPFFIWCKTISAGVDMFIFLSLRREWIQFFVVFMVNAENASSLKASAL